MSQLHRHRSRGQSLAEFAVVAPLFILVLMTLLDFGCVVYAWNARKKMGFGGSTTPRIKPQEL